MPDHLDPGIVTGGFGAAVTVTVGAGFGALLATVVVVSSPQALPIAKPKTNA